MPIPPPTCTQAIIRHKWVTFAKTFLVFNIACFLLWLSAFTGLMMVYSVGGIHGTVSGKGGAASITAAPAAPVVRNKIRNRIPLALKGLRHLPPLID
jgi:hypothetical protein